MKDKLYWKGSDGVERPLNLNWDLGVVPNNCKCLWVAIIEQALIDLELSGKHHIETKRSAIKFFMDKRSIFGNICRMLDLNEHLIRNKLLIIKKIKELP